MDGSNWSSSSTGEKNAAQMTVLAIHPSVRGFRWRSITGGLERGMSVGSANAGACATLIIRCQQIFTDGKRLQTPQGFWGKRAARSRSPRSPHSVDVRGQAVSPAARGQGQGFVRTCSGGATPCQIALRGNSPGGTTEPRGYTAPPKCTFSLFFPSEFPFAGCRQEGVFLVEVVPAISTDGRLPAEAG